MQGNAALRLFEMIPLEDMLWLAVGFVVIIFCVYSSVLLWHWKTYSTGKFTTMSNMFIYLGVAGGFILMMMLSILWFSLV